MQVEAFVSGEIATYYNCYIYKISYREPRLLNIFIQGHVYESPFEVEFFCKLQSWM